MPCIIRNLADDEAVTQMVEDNLNQCEEILLSERAKALKMQLEAIKYQCSRTSGQIGAVDKVPFKNLYWIIEQEKRRPLASQTVKEGAVALNN